MAILPELLGMGFPQHQLQRSPLSLHLLGKPGRRLLKILPSTLEAWGSILSTNKISNWGSVLPDHPLLDNFTISTQISISRMISFYSSFHIHLLHFPISFSSPNPTCQSPAYPIYILVALKYIPFSPFPISSFQFRPPSLLLWTEGSLSRPASRFTSPIHSPRSSQNDLLTLILDQATLLLKHHL